MTDEQLEKAFSHHGALGEQPVQHVELRNQAILLASSIQRSCPESNEKAQALTNLQQALMWAHASIAMHERRSHPPRPLRASAG